MNRDKWLLVIITLLLLTPILFNSTVGSKKTRETNIIGVDNSQLIIVSSNSTDLTVHKIKRLHLLGDTWIILYWIKSTSKYNGCFSDTVWLSDDKNNTHKWFIYEVEHKKIHKGINGPYITRIFPAPYRGLFYITVKVDANNDVNESGMEDNNEKTKPSLFIWLFG